MPAIDRQVPREAARSGTPGARLLRAPAHACPADHPVCRRPARQGAGQAKPVKMQRPAGRTILTGLAWSAGLVPWSTADGMIRLFLSQQVTGTMCQVSDHPGARVPPPEESESFFLLSSALLFASLDPLP